MTSDIRSACPNCRSANEAGSVYCSTCGSELPGGAACETCGHSNRVGALFCSRCGLALTNANPVASAPAARHGSGVTGAVSMMETGHVPGAATSDMSVPVPSPSPPVTYLGDQSRPATSPISATYRPVAIVGAITTIVSAFLVWFTVAGPDPNGWDVSAEYALGLDLRPDPVISLGVVFVWLGVAGLALAAINAPYGAATAGMLTLAASVGVFVNLGIDAEFENVFDFAGPGIYVAAAGGVLMMIPWRIRKNRAIPSLSDVAGWGLVALLLLPVVAVVVVSAIES